MPEAVTSIDLNKLLMTFLGIIMTVNIGILSWTVKTTQTLTVQVAVIEERLNGLKDDIEDASKDL